MTKLGTIALLGALVAGTPVMAQGRGRSEGRVPPGQMPPAGMCRIWIDGVPPGQQPAPTDCATAQARVPANARVIYGSNTGQRRVYNPNGQIMLPSGAVINSPNGRSCFQHLDNDGVTRTYCRDQNGNTRARRDDDDDKGKGKDKHKEKHGRGKHGDRDDDDDGN